MAENSTVERKIAYFHYSLSFNYLKKRRFKRIMSTKIYFSFVCKDHPMIIVIKTIYKLDN